MALEDYGALIRSGMSLVPDYARQQAEREMSGLQMDGQRLQNEGVGIQNRAATSALDAEEAFQNDLSGVLLNPNAAAFSKLILKHPKYAQQVKSAFSVQDEAKRTTDLRQMGEVYSAAAVGKFDIASKAMRMRVEADKAGDGAADPQDEAILAALESGDPVQQKAALGQVGIVLSAITGPEKFSATLGSLKSGNEDFTLSPGAKRFDAAGNQIASADFAPRTVSVSPGVQVFEYQPGGGGPASGGGDVVSAMLPITMASESGGRDYAPGGGVLTSPAGAQGRMQVMPGTQADPGFGVTPARDGSMEEKARVGRDYLKAMVQRYGDPAKAWAAYNAGPGAVDAALAKGGNWLQSMPAETQAYVSKNMRQMGGGQSNMRQIASGGAPAAKPTAQRMSPAEVMGEGLDPTVVYYRGPDGVPKAVGGQAKPQAKAGGEAYSQSAIDAFDRAIKSASGLQKHRGLAAGVGMPSINPFDGNLAGFIAPGSAAADFRTSLDTMKAQVFLPMVQSMKGMGALSNAEGAKLTAALGNLDPAQSETQFKQSLKQIVDDLTYYKNRASKGGQSAGPVKVRSIQEAMKLAPGTPFIDPKGVRRIR